MNNRYAAAAAAAIVVAVAAYDAYYCSSLLHLR